MKARTTRREIGLLMLLAIAVRVPWLLLQPTDPSAIRLQLPDQAEYLEIAHNLLSSRSLHFHDPRFDEPVYAFRMPGYPLFMAVLGARPTLVRLAQVLMDAASVAGVYLLARRWIRIAPRDPLSRFDTTRSWRDRLSPALLAGGLVALNPWMVYFSSLLLTETLFTAMLVWGMVLLSLRWPARRGGLIAGMLLLAASLYVRPSAVLLPMLLTFAAVLANRPESRPYHSQRKLIFREALILAVLAAGLTGLFLLPWGIRNRLHPNVNTWIWTTTNAGFTAYDGLRPGATGASDQTFVQDMPELQAMSEVERSAYLKGRARHAAAEDPGRLIGLTLRKVARTWSPLPLSAAYSSLQYILPGVLYSVPFFLLVVLGMGVGPMTKTAKLFLLFPAIYLTLIHGISVGSARYRVPAEAPLAVIAAGVFAPRGRGRVA